jgi:hypothetical protein
MQHLHHFICAECAAYFSNGPEDKKHFCVHRDGACKLLGDSPARCRYLEEAVLPIDTVGSARAEYTLAVEGTSKPPVAPYAKRAICIHCGNPFTAPHNRDMYCSDECRRAARKVQVRHAVRRHRQPNVLDALV